VTDNYKSNHRFQCIV